MTANQFKMIICACAGVIVSVVANLDRIPTSDKLQWTVDHAVPFVFGTVACFIALSVWQMLGNNIWSIKSWTNRHFKKFCDEMSD